MCFVIQEHDRDWARPAKWDAPVAKMSFIALGGARYSRSMSLLFGRSEAGPLAIFGHNIPKKAALWLVRLWIAIVIVGSLMPGQYKEKIGASPAQRTRAHSTTVPKHRIIHVLAFGSSCFFLGLLASNRRAQYRSAVEILLLAALIELAQDLIYAHGKMFEWWDLRDDAIGILLAVLVLRLIGAAATPQLP